MLLLVQLPGLLELRQLAVEHVGGGRHRRLGSQQGGDGRPLLGLVLASPNALQRIHRHVSFFYGLFTSPRHISTEAACFYPSLLPSESLRSMRIAASAAHFRWNLPVLCRLLLSPTLVKADVLPLYLLLLEVVLLLPNASGYCWVFYINPHKCTMPWLNVYVNKQEQSWQLYECICKASYIWIIMKLSDLTRTREFNLLYTINRAQAGRVVQQQPPGNLTI